MSYREIFFDVIFCDRILEYLRHCMRNFVILSFEFYLIGLENLKFQLDARLKKLINTSISICNLVKKSSVCFMLEFDSI
jgi:hypothetical protein